MTAAIKTIQLQIVWSRMIAAVEEQARSLIRAGFSTSTREAPASREFSTSSLTTEAGRSTSSIPMALGGAGGPVSVISLPRT